MTDSPNEKVTIEIWSDIVCPFCFIGKKKIEKAINELNAENKVEIIWRSFLLDPSFPENKSTATLPYLTERKGYPARQVKSMCDNLTAQGKEYGIAFRFDRSLTMNTRNAHRLIKWASTQAKGSALKEALMQAHFENGIDLSSQEELIKVVTSVNLDTTVAKSVLNSEQFVAEVKSDIDLANNYGITGVPFFIINKSQTISGAQNDEVFMKTLKSAISNLPSAPNKKDGAVCAPSGECK